jgi:hypothetical protein
MVDFKTYQINYNIKIVNFFRYITKKNILSISPYMFNKLL